jgi:hypothetical protein
LLPGAHPEGRKSWKELSFTLAAVRAAPQARCPPGVSIIFDTLIINTMILPRDPGYYHRVTCRWDVMNQRQEKSMKKILILAVMGAAASLVISCASAPPAKPPEQPTTPPPAAVPDPQAERDQARSLQQKVDQFKLGTYDQADYQAAGSDLQAGEDAYGKDNAASKKSFLASIDEYNAVLTKGGPLFLADAQKATDASRKAADDLKASVAVKDDYATADAVYQRALSEKNAGDIANASKDFTDAQTQFDAVARTAQQKKDAATAAIKAAQQDQTASQQKANDAQKALSDEGFSASGS